MIDKTQSQRGERGRGCSGRLMCGVSLSALLLFGLSSAAAGADRNWDANGTAIGNGGIGTWNISGNNWSPNSDGVSGPYGAWDNTLLDNAIFGGTAGTVTLGTPITVHNITFQTNNGYILSSNTLTLAGTTPTITTTTNATISSILAGTAGLTKAGAGTLTLSGINTFSGGITLNAGGLTATSDAALGAVGNNITTGAGVGTTLRIDGAGTSRTVAIGTGGTLTVAGTGVGSALITGDGNVSVATIGPVTLSNDANTYTGTTRFNGCNGVCSAYFTSIGDLGQASSLGAPTTVANGTITFAQTSQYTDSVIYIGDGDSSNRAWSIAGLGAIIRNQGTGTLTLTGNIAGSGGTTFTAETADIQLLGTISGNNFGFGGTAGRTITLGGANTFTGTSSLSAVTVNVSTLADSGTSSSLGAGTTTNLGNGGILRYTGTGATSNRIWTSDGATRINNDGTGALTLSGGLSFIAGGSDTLTLGGTFGGTNTLSGVISGTGNLASNGSGTWVLSGPNTYSGTTTVQSGTLRAGSAGAFGATTGFVVDGGTLDFNGFGFVTPALNGSGGTVALGSGNLTVSVNTGTSSYAGSITGTGGLTKLGGSTLVLSGANTYTGATTIGGGTLRLDFSTAGGPTSDIVSAASTLNMSGGKIDIVGAAGEANSQSFGGFNISAGSNTVSGTSGTGGSLTVDLGLINRTGGLVNFLLPGTGAITTDNADGLLGGWATISGTDYAKVVGGNIVAFTDSDYTDQDDAALWASGQFISDSDGDADSFFGTVGSSIQLSGLQFTTPDSTTTVTVGAGQTLGVDGTIIVAPSVLTNNQTITGGSLTGGGGGTVLGVQQNGGGTFTIASTIVDNGGATGFAKGGTGTVALTGANTYTGATTLSQGTLSVDSIANGGIASSIGASSAASSNLVLEGGILNYTGGTTTSDRGFTLVNGGAGAPDIRVATGASNLSFNGLVTSPDDAGLTKSGAGTLTLGNSGNDYVGVTTINAGTLAVSTLANGGVASSIGASSNASSNLVLQGGRLQYTGGTITSNRGFTLGVGNGRIDVANAATVLTLTGQAVGTGAFIKEGTGTLVLSGINSYTGNNQVAAGTLRAGSTQAFGSTTSTMTVDAGATLDLAGFNNTVGALAGAGSVTLGSATLTTSGISGIFSGAISGTGGFTRSGLFTQTLSGCNNNYIGATTINGGGTLAVDCLANGGLASGIGASGSASGNLVFNNGTLSYTGGNVTTNRGFTLTGTGAISVASTLEFSGIATGSGQLTKSGAGTLILSGANTLTGNTSITAGILRAGSATSLGTGAIILSNVAGATLDMNNFNASFAYLSGGGALGGNIVMGSGNMTLTYGAATTQNYAGAISGSGGITKGGAATYVQVLGGCNNSYTGPTTINSGVLSVDCLVNGGLSSSIGASNAPAGSLVLNGGTLRYTGAATNTDRLFTLGSSATSKIEANGTGAIAFTNAGAIAYSTPNTAQTITLGGTNTGNNSLAALITNNSSGATSLTKTDAGTWILTNPNSNYTGVTTISGGVLGVDKLSDGGFASSIGASSNAATSLVIGTDSTLRYTGTGDTTNRLFKLDSGVSFIESSGTGAIVFSNTGAVSYNNPNAVRTVALGGTNAGDNVMGASIGNSGSFATTLAKNDAGKWILTGNNTYTGPTNINAGTLIIGNGGTTGSIVSSLFNNAGILGFNRSDSSTFAGTIVGTGSMQQLGTGTTVLTGANTYTGGTTISAGTLQLGNGGTTGSIVGNVTDNGTLAFNRNNAYTFAGIISGSGAVTQIGTGTTTLTADNTYTGSTTISAGTLQVGSGGTTGSIGSGNVVNNAALIFNRSNNLTVGNVISGTGTLTKQGAGTLTLTANNSYTGLTTISAGTLQIGNGGATGSIVGNVLNNGALVANRSGTLTLGGTISGGGTFTQSGPGTTILTGANTYAGATTVSAGTLLVNGNQSGATGVTSVASGATLGGIGTIGGSVTVADGGTLAAGSNGIGALTIGGNLTLGSTSQLAFELGQANVPGGTLNDLVTINGNVTLDGTVNVTQTAGGSFGPGVYRMFNYAGALTDNGLTVGSLPSGTAFVQTAVANQVNLVNTAGLTLNFWDGAAGPKNDSLIQGGNGAWVLGGGANNWTGVNGTINADYAQDSFAIFQGTGGTVTVDNSSGNVSTTGMQFTADGYTIAGAPLTLTGAQALVRTGDGTGTDSGITATIDAALTGAAQLVKDLAGTLVLTGTNSYTGGTAINGGTLRISSDANLGDVAGSLSFDGGTLHNTAIFTSARDVTLNAGGGTFQVDATLGLTGVIGGAGALTKTGAGDLVLLGANTYTGGTTINSGDLRIGNGGTTGSIAGDVASTGGILHFNRSNTVTFAGVYSGVGNLYKEGAGTLILTGNNTSTGTTRLVAGTLQIGAGGTTGSISNSSDIVISGPTSALVFNRSDTLTYGGNIAIIGAASMTQAGTGTTILTGTKSGSGAINVTAGTLLMNGNASASSGLTSVASGATLGGTGIIGGSVAVADGGALAAGSNGVGTLTINGALSLAGTSLLDYQFGQSNIVGGPLNDLVSVGGNLTLDGTINVSVTSGGNFDAGLYRVISYGGTLTDNGLALGTMPPGSTASVQTSIAGQVNLVNSSGFTLNFWDGAVGPKSDGAVNGGDGVWQSSGGNDNWTEVSGSINAGYSDGAFAIFSAASGIVNVDNSLGAVIASGMQFASNGYVIQGDALTLTGSQSVIRIGDGTAAGLGFETTITSQLTGAAQLVKTDLGTLILSGTNSYTGGTRINAGVLRIASDANLGDAAGDLSFDGGTLNTVANISSNRNVALIGTGTLLTDGGTTLTLAGAISGAGSLTKAGAGTLVLGGSNSYAGATTVADGALFVNGDQSAATGLTSVNSGATLGGSGVIGGDVSVADGATLAAGNNGVGTLTINGGLTLGSASLLDYQFGQANTVGGPLNDLVQVGGDLVLDGTINVSVPVSGTFDAGIYRVFNYGGTLTDNGLTLGTLPVGSNVFVQTSIANQVNLVNTAGLTLNFWDGPTGPKNDGVIQGGSGIWRIGGGANDWADATGSINADYSQDSFAIFTGTAGVVTVDNGAGTVGASGLQFAVDGYMIVGDPLNLVGPQSIIRVGDGTAAGTAMTATIASAISGATDLVKTDLGTLVLSGTNSYVGTTSVNAGTLLINGDQSAATGLSSVGAGANMGGSGIIGGDVVVADGATLTPGSNGVGTLTINGNLSLDAGSILAMEFGEANAVGGALDDLINVGGNVVLDGTIDVAVPVGASFDPGIYRVANYGGTLTDNSLSLGIMPVGSAVTVQTSIAGQVNLINAGVLTLNFWDGAAGPKFDGLINGGDGVWQNSGGNNNWADQNGAFNGSYQDAGFAIFSASPGTVTIDNSLGAVRASGMQFASNGYLIQGDALTLTDPQSIVRVGDGTAAGAGMTATIGSAVTGATELVKTDLGTLVLTGTNSYTGGTAITGGTLSISSDANLGDIAGGLSIDGGTLKATANMTSARTVTLAGPSIVMTDAATTLTLSGMLSGTGTLHKTGAGTLMLTGDNSSYAGDTQIEGTLAVNGSLCGDINVLTGGRLQGIGTVCTTNNMGTVAPGNSIGTLTVAGDYTGNGGTLEIETELGADTSPTDRLVVTGNTAGATAVRVINVGGSGAQTVEGIKIVDVAGASNGSFTLNGDYVFQGRSAVIAGAYGYTLHQGGASTPTDGDWYLRSGLTDPVITDPAEPQPPAIPLYQPGVPVYEAYSQTLLALNGLPSLQQRVGNRQWAPGGLSDQGGIWGRLQGERRRANAKVTTSFTDTDIDTWKMQIGIDRTLDEGSNGNTLVGGLTALYGKADASVRSVFGNGGIKTDGYGLGATLTWYTPEGFYADGQAQFAWYDSDLKSSILGSLNRGNNGNGQAISLEAGKRASIGGKLSLTPQIQMVYSHVDFDRFADRFDAVVSASKSSSLETRWGLSLDHQNAWDSSSGSRRSHVYGVVNLSYEWLDGSVTDVSGTRLTNEDEHLWGELGLGGSITLNERLTLYGQVSGKSALSDFGDSYSLKGNVGLRLAFW